MADCLFCKIIAGEIPVNIVARSDTALAFRDIAPQAPTHVLVVPIEHYPNLAATVRADPALLAEVYALAAEVADIEGIAGTGWRSLTNTGEHAMQSVEHLHVHVLGGRPMGWPPG